MKVACQQCGAAYSVSDDKVAGRKLRLRCKKCGEAIAVDGTEAGARSAPAASSGSPPRAIRSTGASAGSHESVPEWHVAVGETTQGPYTLHEIAEYYAEGNIVLDTPVYREGWPDWRQAGEVAELQEAAGAMLSRPTPPGIAAIPAVPQARSAVASAASAAVAARPVAMGSDPFAAPLAMASSPRLSAADMMEPGFAHEGTVQFSLDQIKALSAVSAPSLMPASNPRPGYASGDGSGLIDVASLGQAAAEEPAYRPIVGAEMSPLDTTMAPMSLPVTPAGGLDLRTKVFASLAALAIVLIAAVSMLALTRKPAPIVMVQPVTPAVAAAAQPPAAPPAPAAPVQAQAAAVEPKPAQPATTGDVAEPKPAARAVVASDDAERSPKSARRTPVSARAAAAKHESGERVAKAAPEKPEKASGAKSSASSDFDDLLGGGKSASKEKDKAGSKKGGSPDIDDLLAKAPSKPAKKEGGGTIDDLLDNAVSAKKQTPKSEAGEAKGGLPQTPSRDDMKVVYGRIVSKVKSCKGSGVATAEVSVAGSSGRATSVSVSGVEGPAKSCVETAIRSTPFPKFQKDGFQVKFPFKLGA